MALFISVSNNIRYDHFIRLIDANLSLLGQKNIPTIVYDNFFIYEGKDLFTIPEITIEFEGFYFATSINIQNSNYLDCNYSEAINNCFKNEFFYKVVDKTVDQMNEQEKALVSMYYSQYNSHLFIERTLMQMNELYRLHGTKFFKHIDFTRQLEIPVNLSSVGNRLKIKKATKRDINCDMQYRYLLSVFTQIEPMPAHFKETVLDCFLSMFVRYGVLTEKESYRYVLTEFINSADRLVQLDFPLFFVDKSFSKNTRPLAEFSIQNHIEYTDKSSFISHTFTLVTAQYNMSFDVAYHDNKIDLSFGKTRFKNNFVKKTFDLSDVDSFIAYLEEFLKFYIYECYYKNHTRKITGKAIMPFEQFDDKVASLIQAMLTQFFLVLASSAGFK